MSEEPHTLDDLRLRPFVTLKEKLTMKAAFNCPLCGERIEMAFTEDKLKELLKGFIKARGVVR
ncbi:unnamed protein product [marine sediment metagenome]|uniref:Uncharacterized protein n=1 Tax=marine sediment metagenome TaxID=412755 RepID=X1L1Z2_9ZZZZ